MSDRQTFLDDLERAGVLIKWRGRTMPLTMLSISTLADLVREQWQETVKQGEELRAYLRGQPN